MIDVSIDGLVSYTRIISFTLIDFSNNQFFWRNFGFMERFKFVNFEVRDHYAISLQWIP